MVVPLGRGALSGLEELWERKQEMLKVEGRRDGSSTLPTGAHLQDRPLDTPHLRDDR